MRKIFFTLAFLLSLWGEMPAFAQTDGFAESARNFLLQKWGMPTNGQTKAVHADVPPSCTVDTVGSLTFVNVSQGPRQGFVVYSQAKRVVGYSTTQTALVDDVPVALRQMLSTFVAPDTVNSYPCKLTPVAPLLHTQWGQRAPFNAKCPTYQGQPSVAGCTAVALAQVLNYYRSAQPNNYLFEYVDSRSGAEISVDYGKTSYDWDNIVDDYSDSTRYTLVQADAVAKLVYEAGVACKAQYSSSSTTGFWPCVALERFYNYTAEFLMRKYLPTDYWMKRIYDDLAAGRPLLYSGTGYNAGKTSSHEFVLDGNDADGLVHINWGWNGSCDGYYDIAYCRPGDSEARDEGYVSDQLMICGIRPRTAADAPYKEGYACTSGTQFANDTWQDVACVQGITTNTYGAPSQPMEWGVVEVNRTTGKMLSEPGRSTSDSYASNYFFKGYHKLWMTRYGYAKGDDFTMEAGIYDYRLAYRVKGETEWTFRELPMRPWVEYDAKGLITARGWLDYDGPSETDYTTPYLSVEEVRPMSEIVSGAPFFLWIKTHNTRDAESQGEQYSSAGCAYLSFTNVETGKVYTTPKQVTLYDIDYQNLYYSSVQLIEKPVFEGNGFSMPGGRYKLGSPDTHVTFSSDIYIDVKDKVDYPLLRYGYNSYDYDNWFKTINIRPNGNFYAYDQDDQLTVVVNQKFVTANNVYGPSTINLYLCPKDDPTLHNEILYATFQADFSSASSAQDLKLPYNLYPLEGTYYIYARYMASDGEHEIMPYRWDNGYGVDYATGLYAHPLELYVGKNEQSTLPRVEITDVKKTSQGITFSARNLSASDFCGNVAVAVYHKDKGELSELTTGTVTLPAASDAVTLSVEKTLDDVDYELYFRVQSAAVATRSSESTIPTFATKPGGEVAHYRLASTSAVEQVSASSAEKVVTHGRTIRTAKGSHFSVYATSGVCLTQNASHFECPAAGVYLVKTSAGFVKVNVR